MLIYQQPKGSDPWAGSQSSFRETGLGSLAPTGAPGMTGKEKQRPPLELRDRRPGHVEAEGHGRPWPSKENGPVRF